MEHHINYSFRRFDNYMSRLFQTRLMEQVGSLPYHRVHHITIPRKDENVLNSVGEALSDYTVFHQDTAELLIQSNHAVLRVLSHTRPTSITLTVMVWADSLANGQSAWEQLQPLFGPTISNDQKDISVHWFFRAGSEYDTVRLHEKVEETVLPASYPWLPGGLKHFVLRYLASEDPVLILYGPPGTGKTQLIRHILSELSRQKGELAQVLYTADDQVFERDAFFVDFVTSQHDAMVVEDADHVLRPRHDGNQHLHRFLATSDGLLQSRRRRLIFSSNLPSKLEIDDALARPGRCFDCVGARRLKPSEADDVLAGLVDNMEIRQQANEHLRAQAADKDVSLAEVYAAVRHIEKMAQNSLL